jgi:branched-chain amino acid transport system substrate-binding protein
MRRCLALLCFSLILGPCAAADIVLGQSLPLSGPLAVAGKAVKDGMDAYLARVQREGGVAGHKIVLRALDDGYAVDRHVANVKQLLLHDKVEALVLSAGTSHIDAAYALVQEAGKPLIGAMSGAAVLRSAQRPLIYHLRASYGDEVRRLVAQAITVKQTRVFAVRQDDGLGRDAFTALDAAVRAAGLQLVGDEAVLPAEMDGAALAAKIRASRAEALFLLCVTPCAAKTLVALGASGQLDMTPYALSIVSGETLAKAAGPAARGTVISQVMPNPHRPTTPLVARYQQDMRSFTGGDAFSYFSLEGYVTAMVAVEAARVAHAGATRRTMDEAMQLLMQRELSGIVISRATKPGVRPHPVTLSMIGSGGKLVH